MATSSFVPAEFAFEPLDPAPPAPAPGVGRAVRRGAPSPREELEAARLEADRIREEARIAGWEAGHAAGLDEARAATGPAAAALAEALREAHRQGEALAATLEAEAVELAVMIAEKVVAGAIEERPGRVLDVVTGALRGLVERRSITVLVHPDDAPILRDGLGAVVGELGGVERWDVLAERRVSRGGALIRTAEGELDVRLSSKLRTAGEILREDPA